MKCEEKCEDCGQEISEHDWKTHVEVVRMQFGTGPKE